jgi:hypothetical protein
MRSGRFTVTEQEWEKNSDQILFPGGGKHRKHEQEAKWLLHVNVRKREGKAVKFLVHKR